MCWKIATAKIAPCSFSDWPNGHECGELFKEIRFENETRALQYEMLRSKVLLAGKSCEVSSCICSALLDDGEGRSEGRPCQSGECALASRRQALSLPGSLDWATALSMPWMEIVVPLCPTESGGTASLAWFLMGLVPEREKLASPSSCVRDHILCLRQGIMVEETECDQPCPMGQGACRAATTAIRLAEKETGRSFVLFARHASYSFDGGSLALPVWLGAMALAKGLDASPVLATGALDENGFLLPVGGIEAKAGMRAMAGAKRFVYPASSAARVPSGGFPIHRKEDALFLLGEADERFWRTVHPFSYDPMFFWDQLPVLTSWKDDNSKKEWIGHAMSYAEQCGSLDIPEKEKGAVLGTVCTFLEKVKYDLKEKVFNEILNLFPLEWAKGQEESTDIFRLCQLHITSLNHNAGDIGMWERLAEACRDAVQNSAHSVSPLFLEFYTRQCGGGHNWFFFNEPEELLEKMNKEIARFGAYREQAVGKACGILCAGAAFRAAGMPDSDEEYRKAIAFAEKSKANFGESIQGEIEKLRRDLDLAYIYWDRRAEGDRESALACADRYIRGTRDLDVKRNKPYAEALKARAKADFKLNGSLECSDIEWLQEGQENFYKSVEDSLADESKTGHPWTLYFYNAAIALQDDSALYRECLKRSYELCEVRDGKLNTIGLLGLLPLSLMVEIKECSNFACNEAKELLSLLNSDKYKKLFNMEHFEPLLNCSTEEALEKVRKDTKRFFPFSFR